MTEESGTNFARSKPEPLVPVADEARIVPLDVIRGVAIFGILLVNIQAFSFPQSALDDPHEIERELGPMSDADRVAYWATEILCEMKFVTIFSLLFGVSIGMLARKGLSRGVDPEPLLLLRFTALTGIGMLHGLVLWYGDILFHYGLLAFVVVATFRLHTRVVLLLAAGAFVVPLLFVLLAYLAGPEVINSGGDRQAEIRTELQIYGAGTPGQILELNAATWLGMIVVSMLIFGGRTLAMFWLGLLAVKHGFLHDPDRQGRLLAGFVLFGLLPGLGIEGLRGWQEMQMPVPPTPMEQIVTFFPIQYVGSLLLALGFIGVLGLWARSEFLAPVRNGIAAVGRMALTNYLSHTVICVLLFYSYGLGLFGQAPRWSLPLIAFCILCGQMILSTLWLQRFRFGPMEWIWRIISYRQLMPFRKQ